MKRILGAHMSISGGCYKAVESAASYGMDCVQLFSKSNNQWNAKPLTEADASQFRTALEERKITHPLIHDSYLINLAAPDDELWKKSINAFIVELQRAETLGVTGVVAHPGAFTTSSEEAGIRRIAQALDEVHSQTPGLKAQCYLETTAGQGSTLGWKFEQLADIISQVKAPERLAVCFDTCHVFAAGYPLTEPKDYDATMERFDKVIGLKLLRAFHLNDSKKGLGSRVDRHEHIGQGALGIGAFRNLMRDDRFADVPMYLETPKGVEDGQDHDAVNLQALRDLLKNKP